MKNIDIALMSSNSDACFGKQLILLVELKKRHYSLLHVCNVTKEKFEC